MVQYNSLSAAPMQVLHVVPGVGKAVYGLGPPVLNLASVQRQLGLSPTIWTVESDAELQWASESSGFPFDRMRGFPRRGSVAVSWSRGFWSAMRSEAVEHSDVVHQHGIWSLHGLYVNSWRRITRKPYVLAPQGALSRYSFTTSVFKKRAAWAVYQRKNVLNASCIHAVGDLERTEAREAGYHGPVALIPNGIAERWLTSTGSAAAFRKLQGISADKRICLYLSRITPKKGLRFMIEAMAELRQELTDWIFVVAGLDEFNHLSEIRSLAEQLGVTHLVRFSGPIFDQEKRDAYAAADLFILPSLSEGAPSVVLEALGARVPVITTQGCPWQDLQRHSCGWWTPINTAGIHDALKQAIGLSRTELKAMGERGWQLVSSRYSWEELGKRSLRLYRWLREGGSTPDFIELN
jgi:glycosyltransferase involved in cell wall biosynthesis